MQYFFVTLKCFIISKPSIMNKSQANLFQVAGNFKRKFMFTNSLECFTIFILEMTIIIALWHKCYMKRHIQN